MTSREQLLQAWEFKFPGDPDACAGWAYNWEHAECSTSHPTPRDHYATLYLICNHTDDPIHDFKQFLKGVNDNRHKNIKIVFDSNNESSRRGVTLTQNGRVVLRGDIHSSGDVALADPNVAFYARLEAITESGWELLRTFEASATHGYASVIEHNQVEFDVGDSLTLVTVSGLSPDGSSDKDKLATQFTIKENGTDVARCHLSYCDGSYDPSVGPTVEMIAVRKDHRGKNLLPLLWYWVKCFIEENWTLECFNTDVDPGHIMIKATQLTNATIDTKDGEPITDKDFFYDYAGFSVRLQKGFMGMMMSSRRPRDEEAVLYLPILSREQIRQRTEYKGATNIVWKVNKGARCCDYCNKLATNNSRCSRCRQSFYCNRGCQKGDWKVHKQWCGKTRDEVHEILVEKGLRVRMPDGNYATAARDGL